MANSILKKISTGAFPIAVLVVLLLISLSLMSAATQNSEQFGRLYLALLLINIIGLVTLVVLIGANISRLIRQYRNHATGSRLTVRLVAIFSVLAIVPVLVVYYFSLDFIRRGIDSWFDIRIEKAFDDALELSRISLEERKRNYLRRNQEIADELMFLSDESAALVLDDFRIKNNAVELLLLSSGGQVIGFSNASAITALPELPGENVLQQVRQYGTYVGIDVIQGSGMFARVLTTVPEMKAVTQARVLQALFSVSENVSSLADNVQNAYTKYKQISFLRDPLKFSFILTLSLILLLTLLSAVWAAFYSARRLVAPVRLLAIGTRAVAAGDYRKQLPQHSHDELGFLVKSFNEMTKRVAAANDEVRSSQQQAEGERAYLRAVLGRLSSGVITLDSKRIVRTANAAAGHILGIDLKEHVGRPLANIADEHEHLRQFAVVIRNYLGRRQDEWREEVRINGAKGAQILICSGTILPGTSSRGVGSIIVFDDVTALLQAQRDAAWGEVARRLAHEIKNPLTPIRLSAERIRHKYLAHMERNDAEMLDRLTHTIVQQVDVMKEMVKAFSDYARTPRLELRLLDINTVVVEVLDLYRGNDANVAIIERLDPDVPKAYIDAGRIRQLLHNLIKNALEAQIEQGRGEIVVETGVATRGRADLLELRVIDRGPGIPDEVIGAFFEPYVTTKPKGSGLGLAVVKKIVEEHGGQVWVENGAGGGAMVVVQIPVTGTGAAPLPASPASEPQRNGPSQKARAREERGRT